MEILYVIVAIGVFTFIVSAAYILVSRHLTSVVEARVQDFIKFKNAFDAHMAEVKTKNEGLLLATRNSVADKLDAAVNKVEAISTSLASDTEKRVSEAVGSLSAEVEEAIFELQVKIAEGLDVHTKQSMHLLSKSEQVIGERIAKLDALIEALRGGVQLAATEHKRAMDELSTNVRGDVANSVALAITELNLRAADSSADLRTAGETTVKAMEDHMAHQVQSGLAATVASVTDAVNNKMDNATADFLAVIDARMQAVTTRLITSVGEALEAHSQALALAERATEGRIHTQQELLEALREHASRQAEDAQAAARKAENEAERMREAIAELQSKLAEVEADMATKLDFVRTATAQVDAAARRVRGAPHKFGPADVAKDRPEYASATGSPFDAVTPNKPDGVA